MKEREEEVSEEGRENERLTERQNTQALGEKIQRRKAIA